MDVTPNLVKPTLDATGKPVMDGRCAQPGVTAACPYDQQLTTQANFNQWYRDTTGVNVAIPGTLLLARQANGSYVFDSGSGGFYPIDNQGWVATAARGRRDRRSHHQRRPSPTTSASPPRSVTSSSTAAASR